MKGAYNSTSNMGLYAFVRTLIFIFTSSGFDHVLLDFIRRHKFSISTNPK